jgi:8-oxo-dGTP diphosphatase
MATKPARPLTEFDQPSVAVDVVLLTVIDGVISVLLGGREIDGSADWALPGGIVRVEDSLETTVARVLRDKARTPDAFVEQLFTFGAPERDPRGRVISVGYFALVPAERLTQALEAGADLDLLKVETAGEAQSVVISADGGRARLAFDHADIVSTAVQRLRGKLDYSAVGLELLPELFTLRQLQEVHEAILGVRLAKPAFRRKMLDRGLLRPTGLLETGAAFRPAELYRRA